MVCYLKSKNTFSTLKMCTANNYTLVPYSIFDTLSNINIAQNINVATGDFIVCQHGVFIVKTSKIENGQTNITMRQISTLFDRNMLYEEPQENITIEEYIAFIIQTKFAGLADTYYAMPFIQTQQPTTKTPFIKPVTDEHGLFNLKSYLAYVRRLKNIFVTYTVINNVLQISIEKQQPATFNVDFSKGTYELLAESYSETSVAKITAINNLTQTDFYLLKNGAIVQDPASEERANGVWETITISNSDDIENTVANEFAKNSHSHSIEFATISAFPFYANLNIANKTQLLTSYVSQITITASDNRFYYKSGELKTTFIEKQTEVI